MANEKVDSSPEASWFSVDNGAHDETLVESWLLRLRRERFQSRKSGKTHDFYVTHLANGVHAIAVTTDQQLVMVRQFRAGSRRDSLETPGGLLDAGEDPCAAGARELLEETGYAGDSPELLGDDLPDPRAPVDAYQHDRHSQRTSRRPSSPRPERRARARARARQRHPRAHHERADRSRRVRRRSALVVNATRVQQ